MGDKQSKPDNIESPSIVGASAGDRRRFIKAATAGAAVTTLAARPVWGSCTISGAMSGGSVRAGEEMVDYCHYNGGPLRSPGFWKKLQAGAVRDQFNIPGKGKPRKIQAVIDKMEEIEAVKDQNSFYVPSEDFTYGVGGALDNPGGLSFNLAAIWLDAYYGFTPLNPPGADTSSMSDSERAQAWVTHFDALAAINGSIFSTVFTI